MLIIINQCNSLMPFTLRFLAKVKYLKNYVLYMHIKQLTPITSGAKS